MSTLIYITLITLGLISGVYCLIQSIRKGVTFSTKELFGSHGEENWGTPLQVLSGGIIVLLATLYLIYDFYKAI